MNGNLYGTVIDNQGQVLPGVTVTLTGPQPPQIQVTNAEGKFRFLELRPGSYQVKAQLEGFIPAVQPAEIDSGQTTNIDITLQLAISE
jgi:hypothetical protein